MCVCVCVCVNNLLLYVILKSKFSFTFFHCWFFVRESDFAGRGLCFSVSCFC